MTAIVPLDDAPRKKCNRCGKEYPATPEFFQRNRAARDGLINQCKSCTSTAKPKEIIPEGHKRCPKCKELKPLTTEFFRRHNRHNGRRGNGWDSACKDCLNKQWREKHPRREVPEGHKFCPQCQIIKPLQDFYKNGNAPSYWCRQCISEDRKSRKQTRFPTTKICTECHLEKPATLEYFHKDKVSRDGLKAKCKECVNAHNNVTNRTKRDHRNQYQRDWREKNYDSYIAQSRVIWQNRKARKEGNGGILTLQDIQAQLRRQKHCCYYCHTKFEKGHTKRGREYVYHIEHVIPLSRGGTNDPSNIVLACRSCNLSKYKRLPHEWPEGGRLL